MVCARLHIICGNCGCNDMFEYSIDPEGQDLGDRFEPSVRLYCRNCATIHAIEDNAKAIAQTAPQPEQNMPPAEWAKMDLAWVVEHIRETTVFDAGMVEAMLQFAIDAAALSAQRGDA